MLQPHAETPLALYFDATDVGNNGNSALARDGQPCLRRNASIRASRLPRLLGEDDIEAHRLRSCERRSKLAQGSLSGLNTFRMPQLLPAPRRALRDASVWTLTLTADEIPTDGLLEITLGIRPDGLCLSVSTAQLSSFQPAEGKLLFSYCCRKEIATTPFWQT